MTKFGFAVMANLDDALFERMLRRTARRREAHEDRCGISYTRLCGQAPFAPGKTYRTVGRVCQGAGLQDFLRRNILEASAERNFDHREVEKVLDHLHAQKKLVRLNDDRFLTVEAMEEIKAKVTELIHRKGKLAIQDSKEILGYGRNRAIAVFEYLDAIGLTCRVGDSRVLSQEYTRVRSLRL